MNIELIIELIGVGIGLAYLWLEYKASVWLWGVGMLMSLFYIAIFYNSKFYADAGIYAYYLGANVYGLWIWLRHKAQKKMLAKDSDTVQDKQTEEEVDKELPITHFPKKKILQSSIIGIAIWVLLWFILSRFTDSPVPFGDSFTTALSIVAMYLMAHKHVEHWWLWCIVNVVSSMLYAWKGLYPMAGLFMVYAVVSVFGYYRWKRLMV